MEVDAHLKRRLHHLCIDCLVCSQNGLNHSLLCEETDAFEGLSRKLADQEARMGRFEEENSHIKYLLWNMGDWLVDLGDHLKETGKTLKREAGRREGDEDKEAATGKKRKKTHSA